MAGTPLGHMHHHLSMTFTGAEVTEKDLQEFWVRALCHIFVDTLPVNALHEVAESIVDNYNRHVIRPWWKAAALPAASSARLQGKLGPAKTRPSFHLRDE